MRFYCPVVSFFALSFVIVIGFCKGIDFIISFFFMKSKKSTKTIMTIFRIVYLYHVKINISHILDVPFDTECM